MMQLWQKDSLTMLPKQQARLEEKLSNPEEKKHIIFYLKLYNGYVVCPVLFVPVVINI